LVLVCSAEDAEDFAEDAEKSALRLRRDIDYRKPFFDMNRFSSVFIGG
jgi:hypothetical protein